MTVGVFLGSGVMTREATLPAARIAEAFDTDVLSLGLDAEPVVGIDPGSVFLPDALLTDAKPDVLVLPGGFGCRPMARKSEVVDRIRVIASSCDAVLSISTGTLLLASTGLLNGQVAAGHWLTRDELAPYGVELSDGPIERHGRLFTTSGTPAALEAIPLLVGTILYGPVR
ncbi:MAG: DJ-1/PfpI family protein [Acidimicrobiia bacterium]|nr:DJ-1/PfpI family protein [Acidimicrobiia bacterium]